MNRLFIIILLCVFAVGCNEKVELKEFDLPYNGWDPAVNKEPFTSIDTCYFNADCKVYCEFSILYQNIPDTSKITHVVIYENFNLFVSIPIVNHRTWFQGQHKNAFTGTRSYEARILTANGFSKGGPSYQIAP